MPPKKENDSSNNTTPRLLSNVEIAAAEQKQALYLANAKLCRLVKRCPWMYDRQHPNYAKKHVMDKSWTKIAKDCDDSVASCKERWRNVRAAFARSINIYKTNSGPNRVKPYYLYNELQFLIKPMMDGREMAPKDLDEIKSDWDETTTAMQPDVSVNSPAISLSEPQVEHMSDVEADLSSYADDEASLIEEASNTNLTVPLNDSICTSTSVNMTTNNLSHTNTNACHTPEHLESGPTPKRPKLFHSFGSDLVNSNDADVKFLEALLPDMRAMNTRQKIIFKRKIYQSLEEVFETNTDFPGLTARPNATFFQALPVTSPQNVAHSIANLKEGEMKKLQDFVQHILRQRAATVESNASCTRQLNGQALTMIPRAQHQRVVTQSGCKSATPSRAVAAPSCNGNNNFDQLQPISVKYELIEDEDEDENHLPGSP